MERVELEDGARARGRRELFLSLSLSLPEE
jgi:hypothetical protein